MNNFQKWTLKCFTFSDIKRVRQILLFYFYFEYLVTVTEELKLYIFWINVCLWHPKQFFSHSPSSFLAHFSETYPSSWLFNLIVTSYSGHFGSWSFKSSFPPFVYSFTLTPRQWSSPYPKTVTIVNTYTALGSMSPSSRWQRQLTKVANTSYCGSHTE